MTRRGDQPVKIGEYGDGRPKRVSRRHLAKMQLVEKKLGYSLTVLQGSWNGSVGASAGTHDRSGVVDLAPFEWERKCRLFREIADTAWHRPALPGVWTEHIHTVDIGCGDLAPFAAAQVTDYMNGRNGLVGHAADRQWRPTPLVTRWSMGAAVIKTHLPRSKWPRVDLSKVIRQAKIGGQTRNPGVRVIQKALNRALKAGLEVDGHYGSETRKAYARWERKNAVHEGARQDGIPNERTLKKLGNRRALRFIVTK